MRANRSHRYLKSGNPAKIEMLERRQLLSVTLGSNIITNPGAESSASSATGWTANGTPQVVPYGASEGGFPSTTDPGPAQRGKNFFAGGGGGSESDLFQTIDISSLAANIDAHQIKYSLSGYLGGFSSQLDQATVFANFQGASFNQTSVGPVSAADRQNKTGLLLRSTAGTIPAGTRKIQMQMHFEALSGGYIDGYADNLSMILTSTASVLGKITGTVYNDANGDAVKQSTEGGLANVTVFVDKNKNGVLDLGEPKATTAANGTYTIANLVAGSYQVREIVPATFRATTANPVTLVVSNGGTSTATFGDSQTVLITGNVFNDANGNKIKDATEKGIAGVTVYLDFNNNGQLDSFELKTTTDANGNFKFVEPFGTYVVREVLPAGKTATLGGNGFSVTLAKGKVSSVLLFGDK